MSDGIKKNNGPAVISLVPPAPVAGAKVTVQGDGLREGRYELNVSLTQSESGIALQQLTVDGSGRVTAAFEIPALERGRCVVVGITHVGSDGKVDYAYGAPTFLAQ